jgi:Pyridoxamine 5'-phosphate oxidase
MASWADFEREAPELAARVREHLTTRTHHTLATLRKDGSPRISGTECTLRDGELFVGSMIGARKARDLQRDPRFALHGHSVDPPDWEGDAKVAGRMVEETVPERVTEVNGEAVGPSHLFRADLEEVVFTGLNDAKDKLVIQWWKPGQGVRSMERA